MVLVNTAGLLALRLALYAAGCLVSSIPKQSHLRAGERMRSVFLLDCTSIASSHLQQQASSEILSCLKIRVQISL